MKRKRAKPSPPGKHHSGPPGKCVQGGEIHPRLPLGLGDWLLAAVLVAAVFSAYRPAWHGGFLWDDDGHVTKPELQSLRGLYRIWFDLGATQQYYPLLHTTFWIEHRLWGNSPLGYHLVNIALHALAALMVAVLLRRLTIPGAYLAAAIFALHPVQVESVAWITELKNTLSAVFYLGATLAYLCFDQSRKQSWYWGALGLFVLGLLSKTVTATLPGALLVIFWWQRGRLSWKRDVLPLVPFFLIGAAAGVCTALVQRYLIGADGAVFALSIVQRLLLAGRVPWFYLGQLFWPTDLLFIYPRWIISGAVWRQYLFPAATLLSLAALWRLRWQWRGPLAAVLFFIGTLFPVLGFCNVYPFIFSFVADHFQYLASLGIITLVSAGGALLLGRGDVWHRSTGYVLSLALLATFATLTWRQSRMYADVETLYRTTLTQNPECWMAYNNLGTLMNDDGRVDEAIALYQEAIRLRRDYAEAHYNLGIVVMKRGQIDEAIVHLRKALEIRPNDVDAHNNLGIVLGGRGQIEEAIMHFQKALAIKPDDAKAHNNLGIILAGRGQTDEAIMHFRKALESEPNDAKTHCNLGIAMAGRGQVEEAIMHFRRALEIKPDDAKARYNLGNVLMEIGQAEEAIVHFRKALEIKPDDADVCNSLGTALESRGRFAEAAAYCRRALAIRPQFVLAQNALAWMLATCPEVSIRNGAEAVDVAKRAVRHSGGRDPSILDTLAAAYAETGQFAEAIKTAEQAVSLATARGDATLADKLRMRIKLYRLGSAYRTSRPEHRP